MRCPKCNTLMNLTHLMYIEECLHCGTLWDVFHDKEVEHSWVYGDGYPDDDESDFEDDDEGYSHWDGEPKHEGFYVDVDGESVHMLADPNMSQETADALAAMIRAVRKGLDDGTLGKKRK